MMKLEKPYKEVYQDKKRFSFGQNWTQFLKTLSKERVDRAKKSLIDFLDGESKLAGKTFIDVGRGSGLFSLAAYLLRAKKIVSFDIDEFSIKCAEYLKEQEGNPANWRIIKGSILDKDFIKNLGTFDIVYSWGVLHHTGDMYCAFKNIVNLCHKGSLLYIAIYNKNRGKNALLAGSSDTWLKIKRLYNRVPNIGKRFIEFLYYAYLILGYLLTFRNPFKYMKQYDYSNPRGMNFYTDAKDWLGGYPYEYASPDEIINYFGKMGFLTKKLKSSNGIGNHELLLVKA